MLKIEHNVSTACHHETIGGVEKNHRLLNEYLRSYCNGNLENWDIYLRYFTFCYGNYWFCRLNIALRVDHYHNFSRPIDWDWSQFSQISQLREIALFRAFSKIFWNQGQFSFMTKKKILKFTKKKFVFNKKKFCNYHTARITQTFELIAANVLFSNATDTKNLTKKKFILQSLSNKVDQ